MFVARNKGEALKAMGPVPATGSAPSSSSVGSMRHEDRNGHGLHQASGDPAQPELAHPGMAVRAHHEQIEAFVGDAVEQQVGDQHVPCIDLVDFDADAVPCEMPRDVRPRDLAVLPGARVRVRRERHHVLRSLQQRKRVGLSPSRIDAPLAFPEGLTRLIADGGTAGSLERSSENPYLYRFAEGRLVSEGIRP